MPSYINPRKGQLSLLNKLDNNTPVCMLNLIKYRSDGKKKYLTYMKAAQPFIEKFEAKVIYHGQPYATLIGPDHNEWDKVLIVKYKNKLAFLNMLQAEGYPHHLRTEAIEDSRLICLPVE